MAEAGVTVAMQFTEIGNTMPTLVQLIYTPSGGCGNTAMTVDADVSAPRLSVSVTVIVKLRVSVFV